MVSMIYVSNCSYVNSDYSDNSNHISVMKTEMFAV